MGDDELKAIKMRDEGRESVPRGLSMQVLHEDRRALLFYVDELRERLMEMPIALEVIKTWRTSAERLERDNDTLRADLDRMHSWAGLIITLWMLLRSF
jgi:hypothetical protein